MNPASDVSAKPWWVYLCQVAVVVGVSELCYRFIETPFRHGAAGRILAQLRDKETMPKPWWVYLCQVAVVVGVSELCYRFIETPFRHGAAGRILAQLRDKETMPTWVRAKAIPLALAGITGLVALGGIVFVPATSALSEDGAALLRRSPVSRASWHLAASCSSPPPPR